MIIPEINFSFLNKKEFFHKLKIENIKDNTIVALCGHNGAGKTTLLKILSGLYPYEKRKLIKYDSKWYISSSRVGLIDTLSLKDHLSLLNDLIKKDATEIESLIKSFELSNHLNKAVWQLSDGQFIKASFLLMIICEPKYIFLDEIFNALDYSSLLVIKEEINKLINNSVNIFFSSHNLDIVAELSDRILILKEGEIVFDSINDKISLGEDLKNIYLKKA